MPQMTFALSDAAAELVQEKVDSGEYADASAVVEDVLRMMAEEDASSRSWHSSPAVEHWLRTDVIAAYDRRRTHPDEGFSADEVRERLIGRHSKLD